MVRVRQRETARSPVCGGYGRTVPVTDVILTFRVELLRGIATSTPPLVNHCCGHRWRTRGEMATIEREWAKLIGVNRVPDLRNILEQLHDALWPPSAEE
jgi:hypothetical protein